MLAFHASLLPIEALSASWGAIYQQSSPCPCGSLYSSFHSCAGITIDDLGSQAISAPCPLCLAPTAYHPCTMLANCWITRQSLAGHIVPIAGHTHHIPHKTLLAAPGNEPVAILYRNVPHDPVAFLLTAACSVDWLHAPTRSTALACLAHTLLREKNIDIAHTHRV